MGSEETTEASPLGREAKFARGMATRAAFMTWFLLGTVVAVMIRQSSWMKWSFFDWSGDWQLPSGFACVGIAFAHAALGGLAWRLGRVGVGATVPLGLAGAVAVLLTPAAFALSRIRPGVLRLTEIEPLALWLSCAVAVACWGVVVLSARHYDADRGTRANANRAILGAPLGALMFMVTYGPPPLLR
jgi:hypothetical protein